MEGKAHLSTVSSSAQLQGRLTAAMALQAGWEVVHSFGYHVNRDATCARHSALLVLLLYCIAGLLQWHRLLAYE